MKIKTSNLSISFPPEGVWNHEGQEPRHGGRREEEVRDETTSGEHIPEEEIFARDTFWRRTIIFVASMCHALATGCESGKQENCFCQFLRDCQDAAQAAKGTNFGFCHLFLRRNNLSWLICSFQHLLAFLFAELGTSGAIDGSNQLIMKGNSGIFLVFLSGFKKYLGRYAENWCELL